MSKLSLLALVITLCSCSHFDEAEHNLEFVSGYSYSVVGSTIYLPELFDTTESLDPRFEDVGIALRAWHNGEEYGTPEPTGNDIEHRKLGVRMNIGDADIYCAKYGEHTSACAEFEPGDVIKCDIYIDVEDPNIYWGHESWHCIKGQFHERPA